MDNYYKLSSKDQKILKTVKGPIIIFGAGGFIGINLLKTLLLYRNDVFGVSQDFKKNYRISVNKISTKNLRNADINETNQVSELINSIKPRTILNLAAYGAYSKQKEFHKIYRTNVISTINLIEILKEVGFDVYVHAGSQSEYGINSKSPKEDSELIPNSHYAVSKTANYYTLKYYGKVEKLPVIHLRLYSAFGPWEEPDRLIPVLISNGRKGGFPNLVDPMISRDFIYISDIVRAFIYSAAKKNRKIYGEAFNIGTGKKTTIKDLVDIEIKILKIKKKPEFGGMKNRDWDLKEWYGNISKAKKALGWSPKVKLLEGLKLCVKWQKDIKYDEAYWNFTKQ